MKERGR